MSVFVDDMLLHAAVHNGPRILRGRWSHLMADSSDELRDFAGRLRLNPAWIQKPATVLEHYDITAAVRAHALRLGAVRIAYGEGGYLTLCRRAGIPFDVDLLRRDRRHFQAQLTDAIQTGRPPAQTGASRFRKPVTRAVPGADCDRLNRPRCDVAAPSRRRNTA